MMLLLSLKVKNIEKVIAKSVLIAEQGDVKLFRYYGWNLFIIGKEKISFFSSFGNKGEKIEMDIKENQGNRNRIITLKNMATGKRRTYLLLL